MSNPTPGHGHGKPAQAAPKAVDPAHDIDGKATFLWLGSWALAFFASMWLMLVVFDRVLFAERDKKVENLPNTEIELLRQKEQEYLSGKWEAGPPRKSIEQVMQEATKK